MEKIVHAFVDAAITNGVILTVLMTANLLWFMTVDDPRRYPEPAQVIDVGKPYDHEYNSAHRRYFYRYLTPSPSSFPCSCLVKTFGIDLIHSGYGG